MIYSYIDNNVAYSGKMADLENKIQKEVEIISTINKLFFSQYTKFVDENIPGRGIKKYEACRDKI